MTIESSMILKNILGKTIYLCGDSHEENGSDIQGVEALLKVIKDILKNNGNAFVEMGEYQLQRVMESADKGLANGMYYRIPCLLKNLQLEGQDGICINDIRQDSKSAPLISWANCSGLKQTTTIVKWQDIEDRFTHAKERIVSLTNNPKLQQITQTLFEPIERRWSKIKVTVNNLDYNLDSNLLPAVVDHEALQWKDENLELLLLYEVGLLCDMEAWIRGTSDSCIIYCGWQHVDNLLGPFQELGFTRWAAPPSPSMISIVDP